MPDIDIDWLATQVLADCGATLELIAVRRGLRMLPAREPGAQKAPRASGCQTSLAGLPMDELNESLTADYNAEISSPVVSWERPLWTRCISRLARVSARNNSRTRIQQEQRSNDLTPLRSRSTTSIVELASSRSEGQLASK